MSINFRCAASLLAIAQIAFLQSSALIFRAAKNITGLDIRRYLIKEYGIQPQVRVVVKTIGEEDPVTTEKEDARFAEDSTLKRTANRGRPICVRSA